MPKTFSGKQIIKILSKEFGFSSISQKGSHVKLKKVAAGCEIVTIVPLHKELARGTLGGVLELAQIDIREFDKVAKR